MSKGASVNVDIDDNKLIQWIEAPLDDGSLNESNVEPKIKLYDKVITGARVTKEYQPGFIVETKHRKGQSTTKVKREATNMDLI